MLLHSSIPTPFNCWCHKMTASYTVCLKTQTNNSFKFLLNYGENNIWSSKLVTVKLAFTLTIFFFKCIWILTHVENKSIATNHYYNNTSFYNCLCTLRCLFLPTVLSYHAMFFHFNLQFLPWAFPAGQV